MSLGHAGDPESGDMPSDETAVASSTALGSASPERTAPPPANPSAVDPNLDAAAEPSSPPRKKPEPRLCGVCGTQPGKYKCPRCSLPYCSVACNKQHKENHPPDAPKSEPHPPTTTASAAQNPPAAAAPPDADPYSILLDHRPAFQRLFQRYPTLPAELARIQETTLPPADTNADPLARFTASIPGYNNNNNKKNGRSQQPWTRDVGLRRGAEALRKARTDPSDTGDGVREFCDLVRLLLGRGKGAAERAVQEEVAAEEARVIERLMREEGG